MSQMMKKQTGKVVGTIILLLSIFSILCERQKLLVLLPLPN